MLKVENDYLKCTNCNLNYPIKQLPKGFDPLKIVHNCKVKQDKYDRHSRAGLVKKAINFTKATKDHLKAGKKQTEERLHLLRLEVCNLCEHGDNKECFICGCDIPTKASWAEQQCPFYKWPKRMKDLIYRNKQPANLRNAYINAGCFFIGSGPSLEKLDLSLLKNRGVLSFAVNNVAAYKNIKPNFWCSCDNPQSFHECIWKDPSITKFVRTDNAERKGDYPNLYTFDVNEDFNVNTFFDEPTVNFGNHSELVDAYGNKGGRSVIYCSFRIMYYLGIRRIYLIGCDFKMDESRPYVFDQSKWKGGCSTNNKHYEIMNVRFKHLDEKARKVGLRIYNCSPESQLTAFDKLDYNEAIKKETIETPNSLANMYGSKC